MPASPAKNAIEEISSLDLLKLYILTQERREQKQGVSTLENKEFVEQTLLEAQEAGDSYAQSHGAKTMKKLIDGANFLEKLSSCFANDDEKNEYLRRLEEFKKYIDERSGAVSENDRAKTKLTISLCNFLLNCHELDLDVVLLHFPPSKEDQNCFQGTWERLDEMRAAKGLIDSLLQESCDHLAREEVAKVADINRGAEVHFGAYLNKLAVGKIVKEAQTYSSHATNSSIFLYQDSFAGSLRNKFIKLFDETVSLQQIETIIEQALNELKFEIEDDASLSKEQKDFGKKFIDEFLKNKKVRYSSTDTVQQAVVEMVEQKLKKEFRRVFCITKEEAEYFFEPDKKDEDKVVFEKAPATEDDYENVVFAIKSEELLARVGKKILSELQELSILMQGRDAIKIGNQKGAATKPETEPQSENVDIYSQEYYQKMLSLLESGDKWQISRAINYFYSLGKFGSGSATLIAYRNVAFEALLKIKDAIDAKIVEFNEKKSELGRGVVEAEVKLLSRQLELKQLARKVKSGHLEMLLFKERHPKALTKAKSEIVEIDLEIEKLKTEIDAKRQFLGDENQVQKSSSSIDDLEKEFAEKKQKLEEFEKTENPERDFVYKLSRDRLAEYIEEKNKLLVRLLGNSQDSLTKVFDGDVIEAKPIADIFQSLQSTAADINKLNISQIFSNSTTEKILEFVRNKDAIYSARGKIVYSDLLSRPNFAVIFDELCKTAFESLMYRGSAEEGFDDEDDVPSENFLWLSFIEKVRFFAPIIAEISAAADDQNHKDKNKIKKFKELIDDAEKLFLKDQMEQVVKHNVDFFMLEVAIGLNDANLIERALKRFGHPESFLPYLIKYREPREKFAKLITAALRDCSPEVFNKFIAQIESCKVSLGVFDEELPTSRLLRAVAENPHKSEEFFKQVLEKFNQDERFTTRSIESLFKGFFDIESQRSNPRGAQASDLGRGLLKKSDIEFVVEGLKKVNEKLFEVQINSIESREAVKIMLIDSLLSTDAFFVLTDELKKAGSKYYSETLNEIFGSDSPSDCGLAQNFSKLNKVSAKRVIDILLGLEIDREKKKNFFIDAINWALCQQNYDVFNLLLDEVMRFEKNLTRDVSLMREYKIFGVFDYVQSDDIKFCEAIFSRFVAIARDPEIEAENINYIFENFFCKSRHFRREGFDSALEAYPMLTYFQRSDPEKIKSIFEQLKIYNKDFIENHHIRKHLKRLFFQLITLENKESFNYFLDEIKGIDVNFYTSLFSSDLGDVYKKEHGETRFTKAKTCDILEVCTVYSLSEFYKSAISPRLKDLQEDLDEDAKKSMDKDTTQKVCRFFLDKKEIECLLDPSKSMDFILTVAQETYGESFLQNFEQMQESGFLDIVAYRQTQERGPAFASFIDSALGKIIKKNEGSEEGRQFIARVLNHLDGEGNNQLSNCIYRGLVATRSNDCESTFDSLKALRWTYVVDGNPEQKQSALASYNLIFSNFNNDLLESRSSAYSRDRQQSIFDEVFYNAIAVNVLNGANKTVDKILAQLQQKNTLAKKIDSFFSVSATMKREFKEGFVDRALGHQDYNLLQEMIKCDPEIFAIKSGKKTSLYSLVRHFIETDFGDSPEGLQKKEAAAKLVLDVFDLHFKKGWSINRLSTAFDNSPKNQHFLYQFNIYLGAQGVRGDDAARKVENAGFLFNKMFAQENRQKFANAIDWKVVDKHDMWNEVGRWMESEDNSFGQTLRQVKASKEKVSIRSRLVRSRLVKLFVSRREVQVSDVGEVVGGLGGAVAVDEGRVGDDNSSEVDEDQAVDFVPIRARAAGQQQGAEGLEVDPNADGLPNFVPEEAAPDIAPRAPRQRQLGPVRGLAPQRPPNHLPPI